MQNYSATKEFITHNFRHFNAKTIVEAAEAWQKQLAQGNKMFLTLAGAMSTAEIGISLADLIREKKVHAICCTAANLEEDIFNLVAHHAYERIPNWRDLSAEDEMKLKERGLNRVTDTCIPEEEAMLKIEAKLIPYWKAADQNGVGHFPHEYMYKMLLNGDLENEYQIDPKHSWMLAAAEANLPIFVPGWEDSTLGNKFVALHMRGIMKNLTTIKMGLHQMESLIGWYQSVTKTSQVGFFQVGGGIAGDFPICAVPLITEDLHKNAAYWSYFCQISDSTTSYGSYSGAVPNEKITWGKLDTECPKFIIESDASIVAPLVFAYLLG